MPGKHNRTGSEGTSLDFQKSQLTGYCQLQGWTVVNSYVDGGYSGKNADRPGLQRLLTDAKLDSSIRW